MQGVPAFRSTCWAANSRAPRFEEPGMRSWRAVVIRPCIHSFIHSHAVVNDIAIHAETFIHTLTSLHPLHSLTHTTILHEQVNNPFYISIALTWSLVYAVCVCVCLLFINRGCDRADRRVGLSVQRVSGQEPLVVHRVRRQVQRHDRRVVLARGRGIRKDEQRNTQRKGFDRGLMERGGGGYQRP